MIVRKFLLSVLFSVLGAMAMPAVSFDACAADLAPVTKAPPAVVVFNWTGFYLGANAGYGWARNTDGIGAVNDTAGLVGGNFIATSLPIDANGFVGGGQIGYNRQVSPLWVVGLETDLAWTDIHGSVSVPGPNDTSRIMTGTQKLDWLGTVRGRVGIAPADRTLIFATGGFAYGHGSLATALTRTTAPCAVSNCQQGSTSGTLTGWTVGGGAEWAFATNWSAKAEYLYYDLGNLSHLMTDPQFPSIFNANADFTGHIVRLGVNYRF
jgi:outer membrane immunogenic protein